MKYCPACQTRYDEEILRFCTKDGAPLIDEDKPAFTEMPSESVEDDFGEETIIRRNNPPKPESDFAEKQNAQERIVIPTNEVKAEPQVRAKPAVVYQQLPKEPNTTKLVVTTILGTLIILASVGGIFWVLSNQNAADSNKNINVNTNFNSLDSNTNTNFNIDNSLTDFNLNANSDLGANFNTNFNINLKTPTPTPTRTPIPTPTLTPNVNVNTTNVNTAAPTPTANVNIKPTATIPPPPTPATPKPSPTATPVEVGVLNGRAINLPKPAYPPIAKQMNATGQVAVKVAVDELGNITSAKATSGHPLLRAPAEAAARQSKINPVKIKNQSVQATGILLYNFINQ